MKIFNDFTANPLKKQNKTKNKKQNKTNKQKKID